MKRALQVEKDRKGFRGRLSLKTQPPLRPGSVPLALVSIHIKQPLVDRLREEAEKYGPERVR